MLRLKATQMVEVRVRLGKDLVKVCFLGNSKTVEITPDAPEIYDLISFFVLSLSAVCNCE